MLWVIFQRQKRDGALGSIPLQYSMCVCQAMVELSGGFEQIGFMRLIAHYDSLLQELYKISTYRLHAS